jgi:diaminopimelate epimerase
MQYLNADGNESTMCGNGGRCIVALADFLSPKGKPYRFISSDGEHTGVILDNKGSTSLVSLSLSEVNGINVEGEDIVMDTGSPHVVRFANNVEELDVFREGKAVRFSAEYREQGINVNFAEYKENKLFVRTYERGVENETLSCGTGVTAAALAFARRNDISEGQIGILTRGGELSLQFRKKADGFEDIWLEGPAERVFIGSIDI